MDYQASSKLYSEDIASTNEEVAGEQEDWDFNDKRFGVSIFAVAGTIAVILMFIIFLREVYFRKYGMQCCFMFRRRRQRDDQVDGDRAMAEELQRRLNEEEREAERVAKRDEREAWYKIYIKDYTMVRCRNSI